MTPELRNDDDRHGRWLDRLATGELDAPSRRELFAWLDGEPTRWRRCALALLEAGELEQALGDWMAQIKTAQTKTAQSDTAQSTSKTTPGPTRRCLGHESLGSWRTRSWGLRALALAASILVAFGLGMTLGSAGIAPQVLGTPQVVRVSPQESSAQSASVQEVSSEQAAPPTETARQDGVAAATGEPPSQVHDQSDSKPAAGRSLPESADSIPAYVRSQLERRGYRVDSRHGVVSVSLPDGRQMKLPVDQLQFNYVGRQSY